MEDRICNLCNSEVEDEIHFLTRCPLLNVHRTRYFNIFENSCKNFSILKEKQKLYWLMSSEDKCIIKNVSEFIITLFEERNRIFEQIGVAPLAS